MLSGRPDLLGTDLIAVAGTSIGALNAAMLVRHHADPDHGAAGW